MDLEKLEKLKLCNHIHKELLTEYLLDLTFPKIAMEDLFIANGLMDETDKREGKKVFTQDAIKELYTRIWAMYGDINQATYVTNEIRNHKVISEYNYRKFEIELVTWEIENHTTFRVLWDNFKDSWIELDRFRIDNKLPRD